MTLVFQHPVARLKYRHLELWSYLADYPTGEKGVDPEFISDWLIELVGEGITPYYAERALSYPRKAFATRSLQETILKEWCTLADFWEGQHPVWTGFIGDSHTLFVNPRTLATLLVSSRNFRDNSPIMVYLREPFRYSEYEHNSFHFNVRRSTTNINDEEVPYPSLDLEFSTTKIGVSHHHATTTRSVQRRQDNVTRWIGEEFIDIACRGERQRALAGFVYLDMTSEDARNLSSDTRDRWGTDLYEEMTDWQIADVFAQFQRATGR